MSWVELLPGSHFSIANIPFGIITTASQTIPRPATAIGKYALDLQIFTSGGGFSGLSSIQEDLDVFSETTLNAFAALGQPVHRQVRAYLQNVLAEETTLPHILKENEHLRNQVLTPLSSVKVHLPMKIGNYTDFYAGKNHAYNCGLLFRGPSNALQPNYNHMPVAYHGRASSVVVSGTPIRRPTGQVLPDPTAERKVPVLSPTRRLDIELELGAFVCKSNQLGEPIPVDRAQEHLFGFVLLNDWSARDIQPWESVPLGPFLSKNFSTSISPWVILVDALDPFRCESLPNDTKLLPYLQEAQKRNVYDIQLEVEIRSEFD